MSIQKVARLAGVSTSTVSRVINRHPRVAPETADAVRAAMAELDYTPSERRPGRKPGSRPTPVRSLGFFVIGRSGEGGTPGFFELLRGVSEAAAAGDQNLQVVYLPEPDRVPASVNQSGFDGAILHGTLPTGTLRAWLEALPTVWVMGNRVRPPWGDQVMPDSLEIGDIAARFHHESGHRHTVFINLDAGHWGLAAYGSSYCGAARRHGIEAAVLERTPDPSSGASARDASDDVESIVTDFLEINPAPTGVFVADATQSARVLPALEKHGVSLDDDRYAVVTCNNEPAFFAGLSRRPEVIDIGVEAIGRHAVERLLWRVANPQVPGRITSMIEPYLLLT